MSESDWNLYSIMHSIVGNDSGMIFGPTGSGKSMFVRSVVQSANKQGVKVAVCDTEANYIQEDIEWLKENTTYTHATRLRNITEWVTKLSKGFKLIVVDSIGGPAYGEYTRAGMKEAGEIFKDIAEAAYEIQQYCQQNDAMGLLVNQPTSEFGGKETREQEPFGGKSGFYTKEVLKTFRLKPDKGYTVIRLDVWKSRHMRSGFVLANVYIGDKKVGVKFLSYQGRKPSGWPETNCTIPNPILGESETTEDTSQPETGDAPEMEIPEDEEEEQDTLGGI